jgi:putative acetyltransferase
MLPGMTVAHHIAIEPAVAATEEIRDLVGALDRELMAEYPPEQRHGLALDALFKPSMRFFLARRGGVAVGCGGMALCDGFAELKRMYVRDDARGQGVAQALLAHIEGAAREAGFGLSRLETGDRQAAAIRFYARAGFRRRGAFGRYAAMPPHATRSSVFFEKYLAGPAV